MSDSDDELFRTGGALDAMTGVGEDPAAFLTGKVLNGYVVGERIGKGGMGQVFRASRADADFERTVAIKVVPASLASSELARRFRTEVQILAKLDHPAIAQLYDAGTTEEGWPYLVMEYVDGQPVDAYAADRELDFEARVRLLRNITAAVRFAHARLVVHRDLKPSNVLVTRDGKPKLLDFGIAKLLEPDTPSHTVAHYPMTPRYASPEQLLGADITIGSDIYQLGLLGLAVLGEDLPFPDSSLEDAIRRAADGEDAVLSNAARSRIPADLVAIISRCLHADPDDRYADVNALHADLTRYLDGFPVEARKGSRLYRLNKLVRRNVPATLFATLAAAIAIGGSTYYAISMADARNVAEARAETSSRLLQAMSSMIADTYSELIESRGSRAAGDAQLGNEPLRQVLERTDRLIDSVTTADPSIRGELLLLQGKTNRELSRPELAAPQLEQALELMRKTGNARGEAAALDELTRLALVEARITDAEAYLAKALAVAERETLPARVEAGIYATGAHLNTDLADREKAYEYGLQAAALLEALPEGPSTELARTYVELGRSESYLERRDAARVWYVKAIDLYTELEGPRYRGLTSAYSGLAITYAQAGEYDEARRHFERELDISLANYGELHIRTAIGLSNLGLALNRLGDYGSSLDNYQRALRIIREVSPRDLNRLAAVYTNLGNTYVNLGRLEEAAETFREGIAISRSDDVPRRNLASLLNNSGQLMLDRGLYDEADAQLRESLVVKSEVFGPDNITTARTMLNLVRLQLESGGAGDAERLLADAEAVYRETYGPDHRRLSFMELMRGRFHLSRDELNEARGWLMQSHAHRLEEYDETHQFTLMTVFELVRLELLAGDAAAARSWLERTAAGVATLEPWQMERIEATVLEAEILFAEGRRAEALEKKFAALELIEAHFPDRSDWRRRLAAM